MGWPGRWIQSNKTIRPSTRPPTRACGAVRCMHQPAPQQEMDAGRTRHCSDPSASVRARCLDVSPFLTRTDKLAPGPGRSIDSMDGCNRSWAEHACARISLT
ncbi:hypothetical protein SETIT_9G568300v2 [Setaria italica]|uniref:Uncharacterized protein n=1 Tax=Setaria italica TaxID=4555 RepID=A0A368SWX9_SETIT|nr:hypothetical protein SETIT_9G568300v2 [Setaria italica]